MGLLPKGEYILTYVYSPSYNSLLKIIPLSPTHLKKDRTSRSAPTMENCGIKPRQQDFQIVLSQEIDTQTSHPLKMLFSGINDKQLIQMESKELTHHVTKIQLLQPRLKTSTSQELRYRSHHKRCQGCPLQMESKELTSHGTKIQLLQPRLGTSTSQELRYRSHHKRC
jgi:hypothetical protein